MPLVAERDRDHAWRPWVATVGLPAAGATIRVDEHTLRYTSAEPSAAATPPTAAAAAGRELERRCARPEAGGWESGRRRRRQGGRAGRGRHATMHTATKLGYAH
jgi:hypothetical protein